MSLTLPSTLSPFPYAAAALAEYTKQAELAFDDASTDVSLNLGGAVISGEEKIVEELAKVGGLSSDSTTTPALISSARALAKATAHPEVVAGLEEFDNRLAYRTFLVGHDIGAADFLLWAALKSNLKAVGLSKGGQYPHIQRLFTYIDTLPTTKNILDALAQSKSKARSSNKAAASFALGLQGAKEGEVVTRFPPEPSGYLHIGHTKAAILNQYFAKMYKGKLLIRFDDTNPTKERSEFEETILEDLSLLEIHGDKISHTSDHFDTLYDLAVKLIKLGKAYADDTEQMQMREERMNGIASRRRDNSVEENLQHFEEMKLGGGDGLKWCIRAKISVDNPNKAMRDPVIYRCNVLPHHRTGDKWKIYPTYDFACPVVDSIEGVTHALRTNEYRDRNAQYFWMVEALDIRPVKIWDFSRLNFIYTLLSKRKLHWFVDSGRVRGWDDPRFPTVRGILRRGMTVQALKEFMLSQGPSQAIVSLEWDSLWTLNKKIIDPIAPRFWAISKEKIVPVVIRDGPSAPEIKTLPKHKKNPEVGEKKTVYTSTIFLEQEDAASFEDQEEITLMDWGNAFVRSKIVDADGIVTAIEAELNLDGDFRKTKKKITWLAQPTAEHSLVDVTLLDYDYLITKKKLEENDELQDFVSPVTEFRTEGYADANVKELKKGDIIQFERKGYYILDGQTGEGDASRLEFINIPDGKQASLASKHVASETPTPKEKPAKGGGKKDKQPQPQKSAPKNAGPSMYEVDSVYGEDATFETDGLKMYKVDNVYGV